MGVYQWLKGEQLSWVKENIDLVDYLGQNIKLRFKLVSDGFSTGDGFYFDDINVLKIINNVGIENNYSSNIILGSFPNPCNDVISFNYVLPNKNQHYKLQLTDALGRIVLEESIDANNDFKTINVSGLNNGVYFYKIYSPDFSSTPSSIVVMHD